MSLIDQMTGQVLSDPDNQKEPPKGPAYVDPLTGQILEGEKLSPTQKELFRSDISSSYADSDFKASESFRPSEDTSVVRGGPTTYEDRYEAAAREQSVGEKWAYGLGKAGVTFLSALTENTLGLVVNSAYAIGGKLGITDATFLDNAFTQTIDNAREEARTLMPHYKTQLEQNTSDIGVLPWSDNAANFWSESFMDGLGFMAAAVASSYVPGGIGQAVASRVGTGIAGGLSWTARAAQKMKGADVFGKHIASGARMEDLIKAGMSLNPKKIGDASAFYVRGMNAAFGEAGMEAREVAHGYREAMFNELVASKQNKIAELGQEEAVRLGYVDNEGLPIITEEDMKKIDEYASTAANAAFGLNLLVVGFGQQLSIGKMMMKGGQQSAKAAKETMNNVLKTGGKWRDKSFLPKKLRLPAGMAEGAISESFQELTQESTYEVALDYGMAKYRGEPNTDFVEAVISGIDTTFNSKHGQTAMIIGGLLGGGSRLVSHFADAKNRKLKDENTQQVIDFLNSDLAKFTTENVDAEKVASRGRQLMTQGLEEGDAIKHEKGRHEIMKAYVDKYMTLGAYDQLVEKFEELKTMPKEEFEKLFGPLRKGETVDSAVNSLTAGLTSIKDAREMVDNLAPDQYLDNSIFNLFKSQSTRELEAKKAVGQKILRDQFFSLAADAKFHDDFEEKLQAEMSSFTEGKFRPHIYRNRAARQEWDYLERIEKKVDESLPIGQKIIAGFKKFLPSSILEQVKTEYKKLGAKEENVEDFLERVYKKKMKNLTPEETAFMQYVNNIGKLSESELNVFQQEYAAKKLGILYTLYKNRELAIAMYNYLSSGKGMADYVKKHFEAEIAEIEKLVEGNFEEGDSFKQVLFPLYSIMTADGKYYTDPELWTDGETKSPVEETESTEEKPVENPETTFAELPAGDEEKEEDSTDEGDGAESNLSNDSEIADYISTRESEVQALKDYEERINKIDEILKDIKSKKKENKQWQDAEDVFSALREGQVENLKRSKIKTKGKPVVKTPDTTKPYVNVNKIIPFTARPNHRLPLIDDTTKAELASLNKDEIRNRMSVEMVNLPAKFAGKPSPDNFHAQQMPGMGGKGKTGLFVIYEAKDNKQYLLGYMLDPNAFMINHNGEMRPANLNDLNDLKALNSKFVEGNEISNWGRHYIKHAKAQQEEFAEINDRIKVGEVKSIKEVFPETSFSLASTYNTVKGENEYKEDLEEFLLNGQGQHMHFESPLGESDYILVLDNKGVPVFKYEKGKEANPIPLDADEQLFYDNELKEMGLDRTNINKIKGSYTLALKNGDKAQVLALDLPTMTNDEFDLLKNLIAKVIRAGTLSEEVQKEIRENFFFTFPRSEKIDAIFTYDKKVGAQIEIRAKQGVPVDEVTEFNINLGHLIEYKGDDIIINMPTDDANKTIERPFTLANFTELVNLRIENLQTNEKYKETEAQKFLKAYEEEMEKPYGLLGIKPDELDIKYMNRLKVAAKPDTNIYLTFPNSSIEQTTTPEEVFGEETTETPVQQPTISNSPPQSTFEKASTFETVAEAKYALDYIPDEYKEFYEQNKKLIDKMVENLENRKKYDDGLDLPKASTTTSAEGLRPTNFAEVKTDLSRFINVDTVFSVEELDTLSFNLDANEIPLGLFLKQTLRLAKLTTPGTEYHEAFHAVVNNLLTLSEYKALIDDARRKFKNPTEADLKKYKRRYKNHGLSEARLAEIYYEELMADEFRDYVLGEDAKPWLRKLFDKLVRLLQAVVSKKNSINTFYAKIYEGNYKNSEVVRTSATNLELASVYKTRVLTERGAIETALSNRVATRLAKAIALPLYDQFKGDVSAAMMQFQTMLDAQLKDIYSVEAWEKELARVSEVRANTIKNEIEKIRRAFTHSSLKADNIAKLKKEVHRRLKQYATADPFTDLDEIESREDEVGERSYDKDTQTENPKMNIHNRMKHLIDSLTDVVDEFGFGFVDEHDEKYIRPIDSSPLYNALFRGLSNISLRGLIPKLHLMATAEGAHPHMNKFYRKFMTQVVKDLYKARGLDATQFNWEHWADMQEHEKSMDKLEKSPYFNMFKDAFYNTEMDFIDLVRNPVTGRLRVILASSRNLADSVLETWREEYLNSTNKISNLEQFTDLKLKLAAAISGKSFLLLQDPTSSERDRAIITEEQYLKDVSAMFHKIGLYVNPQYVKQLIIKNIEDKNWFDIYMKGHKRETELRERIEHFQEINTTRKNSFLGIKPEEISDATEGLGFVFERNLQKGIDLGLLETRDSKGIEAVARVTNVILDNLAYEGLVGEMTLQNAKNESIYPFMKPSLLAKEMQDLKSELMTDFFIDLKEQIDNEDVNDSLNMERLDLILSELDSPMPMRYEDNPFFIEWYYNSIKYSPYMQTPNIDPVILLKNLDYGKFLFGGGYRLAVELEFGAESIKRAKDYKTFGELEKQTYDLGIASDAIADKGGRIFKYKENGKVKKQRLMPIVLGVNEAKSLNNLIYVPVYKFSAQNQELTDEAIQFAHSLFMGEYMKVWTNSYEKYDANFLSTKASNLQNFYLFDPVNLTTSKDAANELLQEAKEGKSIANLDDTRVFDVVTDFLRTMIAKNLLYYEETGIIQKTKKGGYVSTLLPTGFRNEDGAVAMGNLRNFILNYALHNAAMTNIIEGDPGYIFSDVGTQNKRNQSRNNSGGTHGTGVARIKVRKTQKQKVFGDPTDLNDGQSLLTYEAFKIYLTARGRWAYANDDKTLSVPKIMEEKVRRGKELTPAEIIFLKNEKALAHPLKEVMNARGFFGKLSSAPLFRGFTSRLIKDTEEGWQEADRMWDKIRDHEFNGRYGEAQAELIRVQALYEPAHPGMKTLHDKLNMMERENIHFEVDETAIKTFNYSDEAIEKGVVLELSFENIKEQQQVHKSHDTIKAPTQTMNNIWTEHLTEATSYFMGQETKVGKLADSIAKNFADRVNKGYEEVKNLVLDESGELIWENILDDFQNSLADAGASLALQELVGHALGQPEYSMNYPMAYAKIQSLFLSYMQRGSLQQKIAGEKFILMSDVDILLPRMDENHTPVDANTLRKNPEKFKDYTYFSRLQHRVKDEKRNLFYSEAIVSEYFLTKYGLKVGDDIPSDLMYLFGVRIPTEDKRSMVTLRIAATMPAVYGKAIMVPREIIALSGADFDIDALYASIFETFISEASKTPTSFGNYLKKKGEAWLEFKESHERSRAYKAQLKGRELRSTVLKDIEDRFLNTHEGIENKIPGLDQKFYDTYIETITEVRNLPTYERNIVMKVVESDRFLEASSLERYQLLKNELDSVITLSNDANAKGLILDAQGKLAKFSQNFEEHQVNNIEVLTQQKTDEYENLAKQSLAAVTNGIDSKAAFDIQYKELISKNQSNFNTGNIDAIIPLTKEEANNLILNAYMGVLHYDENYDIAHTQSSNKAIQAILDELKKIGVSDNLTPTEPYSPASTARAHHINMNTKTLTGIAAAAASVYNILAEIDGYIPNSGRMELDDPAFVKMVTKTDSGALVTRNNERILDIVATMLATVVDDIKHLLTPKLNIDENNLAGIIQLSTILTLREAVLTARQPVNQEVSKLLRNMKSPFIDTAYKKEDVSAMAFDAVRRKYEKFAKSEPNVEPTGDPYLDAIRFTLGERSITYEQFMNFQRRSVLLLSNAITDSETVMALRNVSALVKGDASNFSQLHDAINTIEKVLKIDLESGEITIKSKKPKVFEETIHKFTTVPYIKENILVAKHILDVVAPKIFLTQTKRAMGILAEVKRNTNIPEWSEQNDRLDKEFLAFVMLSAERKRMIKEYGKIPTRDELHFSSALQEKVLDLLKHDDYKRNKFLQFLRQRMTENTYEYGPFRGKTEYRIKGNGRLKPDSSYAKDLSDGFLQLIEKPSIQIGEKIIDPSEVATELINYLITRDALEFNNDSFAVNILPHFLRNSMDSLNNMHKAFLDQSIRLKDLTDMELLEFGRTFNRLYTRHSQNLKFNFKFNPVTISAKQIEVAQERRIKINSEELPFRALSTRGLYAVYGETKEQGQILENAFVDGQKRPFHQVIRKVGKEESYYVSVPSVFTTTSKTGSMAWEMQVAIIRHPQKKMDVLVNWKDKTAVLQDSEDKTNYFSEVEHLWGRVPVKRAVYSIVSEVGNRKILGYFYPETLNPKKKESKKDESMTTPEPESQSTSLTQEEADRLNQMEQVRNSELIADAYQNVPLPTEENAPIGPPIEEEATFGEETSTEPTQNENIQNEEGNTFVAGTTEEAVREMVDLGLMPTTEELTAEDNTYLEEYNKFAEEKGKDTLTAEQWNELSPYEKQHHLYQIKHC